MGEFERSMTIRAQPDRILDFIADIENLPKYLPTTKSAQPQGPDRVRVQGEADGHRYDADGYLRCDRQARRLEWGADEGYYKGWMQVQAAKGNGEAESDVTVHISMHGMPPGAGGGGNEGPTPDDIEDGMQKALESIRNHVEGRGGKVEAGAAR